MVTINTINKSQGSKIARQKYPKCFLFNIGPYDVSFHNQEKNSYGYFKYYNCNIWYKKKNIGCITLSTTYSDMKSIVSVDTKIKEDYQGCNIAYYSYESLVIDNNMGIHTNNQSVGAIKLWRKFAKNESLKIYYINDNYSSSFLSALFFDVTLKKGVLRGTYSNGRTFDPYKQDGALLLVKRNGPLDLFIQKQKPLQDTRLEMASEFKKLDKWKGIR